MYLFIKHTKLWVLSQSGVVQPESGTLPSQTQVAKRRPQAAKRRKVLSRYCPLRRRDLVLLVEVSSSN